MAFIWWVLKTGVAVAVLHIALVQANNILFMALRLFAVYLASMLLLGFVATFGIALIGWSHSVAGWTAVFCFLLEIPPSHADPQTQKVVDEVADQVFADLQIQRPRLKHKLALGAFVMGAIAGYVLGYGELVDASGTSVRIQDMLFR